MNFGGAAVEWQHWHWLGDCALSIYCSVKFTAATFFDANLVGVHTTLLRQVTSA
jgi:hypothetical protein